MAYRGEMHYLTIGDDTYKLPSSGGNGTVTSVGVANATNGGLSVSGSPITSSGTITIGLASGYGDTKNPYASKTKNYVLAAPATANGVPTFRALVAADIPISDWAKASTKPSYNFSEIGSKPTTLSGYGITDAYTKTQVDGLVSGVLHYKGTKATVSALPTSGNTTGDVWHITADGSEWAWDGSTWQELGTAVDLSGYAQLAGASFTGPVIFGDSVAADELETGDLVVTGAASFTNNIAANTINGVTVGSSPKFTDTVTTVTTTGDGNAITAISATNGVITATKGATYVTSSGVTSITLTQGTGISIGSSGTAITTTGSRTISLATITKSDTTSTASPAHGGTFTAVDSITYDTYGRVTGVNTKTITLPADSNTHNTAYLYAGASNGTANAATTNGNTYLILMDGGTATTRRKISGATNVSVSSDASGNIMITGPDLSGYAQSSAIPTETTISGWGFTKNAGTLTGVTFAGTSMSVSSGVASITQANARTALGLATVATSGSYNDLSNKPTIPTNTDEKVKLTSNTGTTAVPLVLGPTSITSGTAYNCLYNTNLKYTPSTGNLQTVQLNGVTVGSSPKFSDTVTTVTASGTGNVVTGMTASNGAITYTMGTVSTTAAQIIRW